MKRSITQGESESGREVSPITIDTCHKERPRTNKVTVFELQVEKYLGNRTIL